MPTEALEEPKAYAVEQPAAPRGATKAPLPALVEGVKRRLWSVDLYGLRGSPATHHPGMRAFWWDSLLATLSDSFYVNYTSLYILALGGTGTQVGWLTSASSLLGMLGPLPGAALTQRWGQRKRMVVVFSVAFRLMLLLAALVPLVLYGQSAVFAVIVLMALRVGFINFFSPAWLSLTRDVVPLTSRGYYFSSRNVITAIASVIAVPVAGQIIDAVGAPVGYQWTLGIGFAVGMLASFAFSHIPEARQRGAAPAGTGSQLRTFWHAMTGNRLFLAFVVIRLLWDLAVQVGGPYFAVYQVEVLKSSPRLIGVMATVSAVARMVGLRLWGRWMDRHNARWVTTVAALLVPLAPFMWLLAKQPWHIVFPSLVGGFLWAGFEIGSFALLLELLEGENSTQAAAGYSTLLSTAGIVGPLIGGWVIGQLGYRGDFAVSGVLRLLTALLFLALFKPLKRRQAAATTTPESA